MHSDFNDVHVHHDSEEYAMLSLTILHKELQDFKPGQAETKTIVSENFAVQLKETEACDR